MIRSELDSYVPERLPARFVPRVRRRRRIPAVGWRPLAVAAAVLILGFAFATVAGGPENFYRSVTQINQSRNLTPVPTTTPTPTGEQTAKAGSSPISSNHPRSGIRAKATPPPAAPVAPVAPESAQTPALSGSQSTPAPHHSAAHLSATPAPTPTPSNQVCLLGIICISTS